LEIKIYSTPTCPYCIQAKKYFKDKNISFENIDVSESHEASEEMVKISGQMGVPVIKIDDNIIIGFDKTKIEKLLTPNE
jgi:glutaredoxin-like YruB-family protein